MAKTGEWSRDILGDHYERMPLPLDPDDEGPLDATLVRYSPPYRPRFGLGAAQGANVLYVHGWSDYFFQKHLAEYWHGEGARFYALDLRKYGRSLKPGQTPGYITNLADYDEEINAALEVMGDDRRLILMGHSTGGLILSLFASRNADRVSALVLNSPWLEFQGRQLARTAIAPMVDLHAKYRPQDLLPTVDFGYYTRAVSSGFDGEWDYDLAWRPQHGFPLHPAWLSAILAGHARVALGLGIEAPVLVMLSTRSTLATRWAPSMLDTDTALDVDVVAQRSVRLGTTVTVVRLAGALHDVTLSRGPVRRRARDEATRWLRGYVL
jgi:alpha-beta hydrolase superfamily lysophospholipase